MTAHPQTNWSIAAARSAVDIPPQRGQLIPFLLAFGHLIRNGVRYSAQHKIREIMSAERAWTVVNIIASFRRNRTEALVYVGVGWSCL